MNSFRYLIVVILALLVLLAGCSDSISPVDDNPIGLAVTPSSGPPCTILEVTGVSISRADLDSIRIYIGGKLAPSTINSRGNLISCIPLFQDSSGALSPPPGKVDVYIYSSGVEIGKLLDAFSVLPLPNAPGTTSHAADELQNISASLDTLLRSLVAGPGEEEQYLLATLQALDSLINGNNPYSLRSALASLEASESQALILDGLLSVTGVLDYLSNINIELQNILSLTKAIRARNFDNLNPSKTRPTLKATTTLYVPDDLLALKMQFYVIAKGFGEQVISETGQTFAETVGLAAGAVGIAHSLPQVELTMVILSYIDFVVNKVIVGLLPGSLDAIDLELASNQLDTQTETDATITVSASNIPPQISLQYTIGNILTLMGASGSSEAIQSFRQILTNTANYFLSTMQGVISSYSSQHPELNLDIDLFSVVPYITWKATATNPVYYKLNTFTPDIIERIENELNWKTKDETGVGRIFVMPSSSDDARILPGYYGGAFGIGSVASPVKSVIVGSNLKLEVELAGAMNHGETQTLNIRAGYIEDETINWTSGIEITIEIEGGSVDESSGTTDESGYFSTPVHADDESATVIRLAIDAHGENDTFSGTTLEVALGKGLPAFYSNGVQAFEGPIKHGYSHSCPEESSHNLYQNVCTTLDQSPVDWALGGIHGSNDPTAFSVSWSGYIFIPTSGEYRFSGWVDGNIYIEINGVQIAKFNTTGSSYAHSLYLEGETWVPVFIFFETNGGSNNIEFKWKNPDGVVSLVPRNYMSGTPGDALQTGTFNAAHHTSEHPNVKVIRRM